MNLCQLIFVNFAIFLSIFIIKDYLRFSCFACSCFCRLFSSSCFRLFSLSLSTSSLFCRLFSCSSNRFCFFCCSSSFLFCCLTSRFFCLFCLRFSLIFSHFFLHFLRMRPANVAILYRTGRLNPYSYKTIPPNTDTSPYQRIIPS